MKLRQAVGALFVNKSITISPKEVYKSTDISYNIYVKHSIIFIKTNNMKTVSKFRSPKSYLGYPCVLAEPSNSSKDTWEYFVLFEVELELVSLSVSQFDAHSSFSNDNDLT